MSENDKVKVTVVYGSVSTWQDGSFVKGESFITTRGEALKIDSQFVEITEIPIIVPVVEEAPKKRSRKVTAVEDKPIEEASPSEVSSA